MVLVLWCSPVVVDVSWFQVWPNDPLRIKRPVRHGRLVTTGSCSQVGWRGFRCKFPHRLFQGHNLLRLAT